MITYNKNEIKEQLNTDQVFDIVTRYGGEPEMTDFGFISKTICHNLPNETHKKKLYYYENTKLFNCYTGCGDYFDVFDLLVSINKTQFKIDYNLNDIIYKVSQEYNLEGSFVDSMEGQLKDWEYFNNYERIKNITITTQEVELKEYDSVILDRLSYPIISSWRKEGISEEALAANRIGYYPTNEQITIPHYDMNGNFVGLRGRALGAEQAEQYGKYRPAKINQILYNHPLSLNLYNLNNSKKNIEIYKKAIVFEGEKSCLLYRSMFGKENDISVACCGSNLSQYQAQLLLNLGIQELVVGFDKQFKKSGDEEYKQLEKKLLHIKKKYSPYVRVSFLFDKYNLLDYKDSPIDKGKETFLTLFKKRVT